MVHVGSGAVRNFPDWLSAYVQYASFSEAPKRMHFWTGVSAIAGALRRRVWLDMAYFQWTPCFYIILVAPPGIVSKTTTASIGMDLLKKVPGVKFGPQVVTWPALVTAFAESSESFEYNHEWHTECALTLQSSEFGNLVDPTDREMIDLLVNLWDSNKGAFKKVTKSSGCDTVENPWINLIACTTPAWIAGNFPEYVIGGGFTSRCIFVYADTKEKYVAYPSLEVPTDMEKTKTLLIQDLDHIATMLVGPYQLDASAITWGREWYFQHWNGGPPENMTDDRYGGYLARKQTHLHKLAMILAASQRDELIVTADDLAVANTMITDTEVDTPKVFARIGRTEQSVQAERFIKFVQAKGLVSYETAYQYIHTHFPSHRDFEGMLTGALKAGFLKLEPGAGCVMIRAMPPLAK